jgi:hypothetical protein
MAISNAGCCRLLLGFVSDHLHITTQALISHFSYRDAGVTCSAGGLRDLGRQAVLVEAGIRQSNAS